jgi:predicted nucleic acid-binding protein
MNWIIVDSGVLIALVLQEELAGRAESLMESAQAQKKRLAAPTLLQYEVVASVRKAVYRHRISMVEAQSIQQIALQYDITYLLDDALLRRAQEIAGELNMPTAYDAQYLAVAERLDAPLWTADSKLAAAGDRFGARWLGEYSAGSP